MSETSPSLPTSRFAERAPSIAAAIRQVWSLDAPAEVAFHPLAEAVEEDERVEDSLGVLAGDAEPLPLLGARAEEDIVEPRAELVEGDVLPDGRLQVDRDAERAKPLEVDRELLVGEAVPRDGAADHAADAPLRLEDFGRHAGAREVQSGGEARGAGADDGDLHTDRGSRDLGLRRAVLEGEALDLADAERGVVEVPHATLGARVVADAAGDARKRVRAADHLDRLVVAAVRHEPEGVGDVLVGRAGLHAGGRDAVERPERAVALEDEGALAARETAAAAVRDDPLEVLREV
ncbi:MAG TPA: hypothetical protein PKA62_10850, partial [Thermoanaerobaculia bacterium]|nr:hypothetical protein [Thermoanaerobaculia bacterium]